MSLVVKCDQCNERIAHTCNRDLKEAATQLFRKVDCEDRSGFEEFFQTGHRKEMYSPGDENAPFFSEAFLYPLVGKEAARTILARVDNLLRASGIEPHIARRRALNRDEDYRSDGD